MIDLEEVRDLLDQLEMYDFIDSDPELHGSVKHDAFIVQSKLTIKLRALQVPAHATPTYAALKDVAKQIVSLGAVPDHILSMKASVIEPVPTRSTPADLSPAARAQSILKKIRDRNRAS